MDRSLTPFQPVDLARTLLSTSPSFEPYVPDSHQDILNSLHLLGSLGEIASQSFQIKPIVQKSDPTPTPVGPEKPSKSASPTAASPLSDEVILEALKKLRNSETFRKRHSGIYSTIIRPNSV